MNRKLAWIGLTAAAACAAGAIGFWSGVQAQSAMVKAKEVYRNPLTGIEGKEIRITQLEFGPGVVSPPHHHPGDTFVYVIDGELVTEIDDGAAFSAKEGDVFHEPPMSLHKSTKNPGTTPAHAVAIMIIDKDKPSTVAPQH
jgi:quercetin dioxygenase-like cupin family protein